MIELLQKSKNYDLIYDQLNRCSIYLGFFRKIGMLKCKLLTIMHHPPYDVQLRVSDSDGYIFFNEDYRKLAETAYPKKKNKYFVNEWMPDIEWYDKIPASENFATDALQMARDLFPDLKKYGLGVVYKTGEVESLVIALNDVKKNCSLYRKNMEEYKKDKEMHIYGNNLKSIINVLRGVEREKK